jgi:hypothetical protein
MGAVAKSPKHEVGSRHPESKFFLAPKILEEMAKGVTRSAACRIVGISTETVSEWIFKANKYPEKYPEYVEFREAMEHVRAEVQKEMVGHIIGAARSDPKHWTAAAWYLERTDPENWGKRDKVEVKNEGGPMIQFNQVVLSDPDAREASRDLLHRLTADRAPQSFGPGTGGEPAGDRGGSGSEVIDVDPR